MTFKNIYKRNYKELREKLNGFTNRQVSLLSVNLLTKIFVSQILYKFNVWFSG